MITLTRAIVWLNTGNHALNLTAAWGILAVIGIILSIEFHHAS